MKLHVGCAMWTHPAWQGHPLPAASPARDRLRSYSSVCNAVEGNTTFYATPSLSTVKSWAEQTPDDFRFVLKLPKPITHERRLASAAGTHPNTGPRTGDPHTHAHAATHAHVDTSSVATAPTDPDLAAFLTAMEPLGPRIHALWIQLPPSFVPADLDTLAAFLRRLPREHRYAVEVRHRAFFEDARWERRLEEVLGEVSAEWVTFDTTVLFEDPPTTDTERESWQKKPRLPRRTRALTDHPIVRYIGRDDPERTVAGWQPWLDTVVDWLREGRSPTVFIHTPDNAAALDLARRFHADVRARLPELEPLPEPPPPAAQPAPANQPTLF